MNQDDDPLLEQAARFRYVIGLRAQAYQRAMWDEAMEQLAQPEVILLDRKLSRRRRALRACRRLIACVVRLLVRALFFRSRLPGRNEGSPWVRASPLRTEDHGGRLALPPPRQRSPYSSQKDHPGT